MISELFDLPIRRYGRYDTFSMLPVCCGLYGKAKFAIYGIDDYAQVTMSLLNNLYQIKPACLIGEIESETKIDDVPILSLRQFRAEADKCPYIVIVAVNEYRIKNSETRKKICTYLENTNVYLYFGASGLLHPFKPDWWCFIKKNALLFDNVFKKFSDQISKDTFLNYMKTYVLGQGYTGTVFPEEYKYWGIDDAERKLFEITEDEVVLNVGACKGDTICQYIRCELPYKKIIAVEGEETNYVALKKMIALLNSQYSNRIALYNVFLGKERATIDTLWYDENISLICMDVEGTEMDILSTGKRTIAKNRPVMSICAYHKVDDLIVIPRFIEEIVADYVFVLRKYPSGYDTFFDGIHQINELVLYAIPKERYIKN